MAQHLKGYEIFFKRQKHMERSMRHQSTNNPYIDIAIILLTTAASILTALQKSRKFR